jgi:CelD/BcsL family acetyltransferase involved in cellulose biosynthesis
MVRLVAMNSTTRASPDNQRLSSAAEFTSEVITRVQDWQALEADWDRLLESSDASTPWQSWSYLFTWWKHLAEPRQQLRIVVVRSKRNEPVLILPLQLTRGRMLGIPLRFLEPIGMLHDVNRPRLALGRTDPAAYECALQRVEQMRDDWDILRIDEQRVGDWELDRLRTYARSSGLMVRLAPSFLCPWLDLRQAWEPFLQSRGNKLRKNLRAAQRKLEAHGPVQVRTYQDTAGVAMAMEHLLELHRLSWKAQKKIGLAQSSAHELFYRDLTNAMAEKQRCRVHILYCGERPIAGTIAFMDTANYYSAEIAHDDRYSACSPGTLLEAAELQNLMNEQRFGRYDFMGGALNNKLRWTDERYDTYRVLLLRPGLRTLLTDSYYFRLKPLALRHLPFLRQASVARELSAPPPVDS